jgi:uncharacterized membrane protein YidH (DUF202 family)
MTETPVPFEVEPSAGNQMAWMNTIFGLQRTLMAAQRTAVTLIAFGFTLAQLFQGLRGQVPPRLLALGPHIPRDVGLLMIAGGIGSLALFTWQYHRAVNYLGNGPFAAISLRPGLPLHQLSCIVAYCIMVIGALAFASVLVSF